MTPLPERLANARDWARRNMPHAQWLQALLFDAESEISGLQAEARRRAEDDRKAAEAAQKAAPTQTTNNQGGTLADYWKEIRESRSI